LSERATIRTLEGLGDLLGLLRVDMGMQRLVVGWMKIARLLDKRSHLAFKGGVMDAGRPLLSIHRGREKFSWLELRISELGIGHPSFDGVGENLLLTFASER